MTAPGPVGGPHALTAEQEVTLRRVAYGQSDVRSLRAQDLEALRERRLISDHRDGPLLTPAGRRAFNALPRAAIQGSPEPMEQMLAELARIAAGHRR